jgi:prolipoprotein diacylglyceryltransferase
LTITTQKLTSLQSSGAGSIEITGLNGGDQTVRIAGAHNLEAHGQLDKLTVELDGAGNVDYGSVTSQEATIVVNGAGHVLVRPTQLLSATVNGIGAIHYKGEPQKVESNLHGIGTIGKQ